MVYVVKTLAHTHSFLVSVIPISGTPLYHSIYHRLAYPSNCMTVGHSYNIIHDLMTSRIFRLQQMTSEMLTIFTCKELTITS